jgi:hypothetical protein
LRPSRLSGPISLISEDEEGLTRGEGLSFRIRQIPNPGWSLVDHANLFSGEKILRNPSDLPSDSVASNDERRIVPRYDFSATAEVTDCANSAKFSGRVTEISRKGCYVDVLNALPKETLVSVCISCDRGKFVTRGKILYVHDRIGMGVVFLDPPGDQLEILDSWLPKIPPSADP